MTTYRLDDLTEVADAPRCLTRKADMALREFSDWLGREWLVWEVEPFSVERHVIEERSAAIAGTTRMDMAGAFGGWLVFESARERRRLAPYPDDWATLTDAALGELLDDASPTQRSHRMLD